MMTDVSGHYSILLSSAIDNWYKLNFRITIRNRS